jgi:hypothetical protein
MQINSKVNDYKLNLNYTFYYFLKKLNGTPKFSKGHTRLILESCLTNEKIGLENVKFILKNLSKQFNPNELEIFELLYLNLKSELDLSIFIFSLQLMETKPLLLQEAKIVEISSLSKLEKYNQLSLEYDELSKSKPYLTRVNGALLSLLFFSKLEQKDTNFISNLTVEYLNSMFERSDLLLKQGIELNQIFMLMFNESMNQSITSDSGSSYEQRVLSILLGLGVPADSIKKLHDENDKSTEYDFYFILDGKKYGVGAKRTLRERYKQFIKTIQTTKIDVVLEFTLGIDLTEEKAKTIRQHGTHLVISDEVYNSREYLQKIEGIFPASKFNLKLLKSL